MKLSDLLVPSARYSKFRCDTYKKFSANPGILYPVWMQLLNPGESASVDLRSVIRTFPVESPLMASMKVRFVTAAFNIKNYAIALEGYKRNFDWRSTKLPSISFYYSENANYGIENISDSNVYVNKGKLMCVEDTSLADYLGYESGWLPNKVTHGLRYEPYGNKTYRVLKSALPFLCYYDFFRNYLANPQEPYYYMFGTVYEKAPIMNSIGDQLVDALLPKSYIFRKSLSDLDLFIENVHKTYDGNFNYGVNETYSGFNQYVPWVWINVPTQFNWTDGEIGNTFSSYHGGLVSTMFDSDINTQWMSSDNHDKLKEVTIKATQSSSGDMYTSFSDIVKASSLWDFVTKSVNSDGTYGDFIGNQFGVTVKGDMNIPQIVHVYDTLLSFDDITSQSDTSNLTDAGAVVGQQFGVGRSYGQSNRFKVINKDGNYIILMTFMWITPQVCYNKGLHWMNNITSFDSLYQPSFDNYAMQARLQEQVWSSPPYTTPDGIGSYPTTYWSSMIYNEEDALPNDGVIGYQPAFSEYKTDVDVVHGLFRHALNYYTIIRRIYPLNTLSTMTNNDILSSYVYSTPSLADGSNYIPAQKAKNYSLPFAIEEEDCCQVQLRVDATITRAMSKNVNPNIK